MERRDSASVRAFFERHFSPYEVRHADGRDPLIRDRRFGYFMGMVIGFFGVLGCLRFHDVV